MLSKGKPALQKKSAKNFLTQSQKIKKPNLNSSDSSDASLEFVDYNDSPDAQRMKVDLDKHGYDSESEQVVVGEELFTELCDAWLKVHGNKVLIEALKKHKSIIQDAVVVAIASQNYTNKKTEVSDLKK